MGSSMNCPICGKELNPKGGGFSIAAHMRTHETTTIVATCGNCGAQEATKVPASWGHKRKQKKADDDFRRAGWIEVEDSIRMVCPKCAGRANKPSKKGGEG